MTFRANAVTPLYWCTDAFIRKYNPDRSVAWTEQFGSDGTDYLYSMTITPEGNIVATGNVQGDFELESGGDNDGYVRMYSPDGTHIWTAQIQEQYWDIISYIVSDKNGDLYIAGYTQNTLGEFNFNEGGPYADAFSENIAMTDQLHGLTSLGLAETMKSGEWQ